MEFKLQNKKLEELDKEIYQFNKEYGLALDSLGRIPNLYAKEIIVKTADNLISQLKKLKLKEEFDILFCKNAMKTINIQKAYLIYFTTAESENLDELFSIIFEKNALQKIKENSKNFDYKKYWEYFLSYQEYLYKQIPSDDESLREEFKKILQKLKEDILDYAEEHFNFPRNYEFNLILGQPYSRNTYFQPTTKRMEISSGNFFVFKEKNEIKINICGVIDVLFHELLGHGRHEFNSRGLPLSLHSDSINNHNIIAGIHKEGIAQINRQYAIDFMKKYKKKYKIEEDYINQIELSSISNSTTNLRVLYNYFKLKEAENKSFNAEKEFKKITGNYGLSLLFSNIKHEAISSISQAKYPLGYHYLKTLLRELKKELGEKEFENKLPIINKAISTGVWNIKFLKDFVKLYLNKN
jgi:hypothetical protein